MFKKITLSIFAVASLTAAGAPRDVFVLIDLARPEDVSVLVDRGVAVVEARPDFALAWLPASGGKNVAGFRYVELAAPVGPVYVAWPRPGRELASSPGVAILARRGDTYIVGGAPAAVEKLALAGAEIKRVGARPVVKPQARALAGLYYNPLVAAAVARVRPDRYFGYVEDLAAFETRYSHAEEIEQATSYLVDRFRDLGYDTKRVPYAYEIWDNDYLMYCAFRPGGRLGWLASTWGYVWRTDDYGATWTAYKTEGRLWAAAFPSDDTGFAVGGIGFLARTDDGGRTWRQLSLDDPDDNLMGIGFYGTNTGVAVGYDGALYRTADGGASWHKVVSGTTKNLRGVTAETASRWWAVGEAGTVLRSDDGGASWYAGTIPEAGSITLRELAFADATHAVIVGYEGLILYSDDGGASWTRVSGDYPDWPYFTRVAFADATRGWAVGSEAKVYRTDDAGANWTRQNVPLNDWYTFEGLAVVSRDEAWAAGYPSALVHTTDAGATWDEVPVQNQNPITWYNVEATKRGVTRPDQIYLLCGHYDAISEDPWNYAPGAEDNASGTAGLLEAAAALADNRFDATVRFVAFSGEEEGLLGSRAYADEQRDNGADIRAALNMDMISYLDEPAHDVEVRYNNSSRDLLDRYRDAVRLYVPGCVIYPRTSGSGGSDHESFWDNGYAALLSIEYPGQQFYPWYHTTDDLPSHLTAAFGADVTRVNLATAASLAGIREGPVPSSAQVIAYPNPARPDRGHDQIRFASLAPGSEVAVYNLAGNRLWGITVGAAGAAEWPLTTADGAAAASGIYLFVVRDADGKKVTGKVAVVR